MADRESSSREVNRAKASKTNEPIAQTATLKVPGRDGKSKKPSPQGSTQKRHAMAQQKASLASVWPMCHGRCCVVGLMVLCLIRVCAWMMGNIPGGTAWFIHILSLGADMSTVTVTMPLLLGCGFGGIQGQCVELGCVGPMMTMVVAMNLVDLCALVGFFIFAAPLPRPADGHSYIDVLEFIVSIWELVLVASCFLNCAVCVSCWRVYRELRAAGLYPPNAKGEIARENVSPFEVLCEAEDVELLAECGRSRAGEAAQCCNSGRQGYTQTARTDDIELTVADGQEGYVAAKDPIVSAEKV
mmetsp:Transcript_116775/g.206709  ORF Transcript_116775/g.206709 Transcript_116775/m.206709 type:complete len:300 (-) Transcript_116775:48-947(-)